MGDLDGDGKLDLAVVNANDKNLVLFRNTSTAGTISFSGDSTYSCGSYNPTGVAISDLDGDGKPDLAVSTTDLATLNLTQQYSVLAFRNVSTSGVTSFAPAVSYAAGNSLYSVALNDMNGDGKPDIVSSDPAGHVFTV